jgi:cell division septation protein DedD
MGGTDAAPARPAAASAPRPVPAQAGGNAPLSIVPQGDTAPSQPPARTHTAVARPIASSPPAGAEPAAAAGGGYSVQVSSQRSEAEAQTAFRALQAKYPNQLGGHQPIVRRADLGDKGVYYRALVGPFASMEQAAAVCSNLKAAGGNCIVQRN